MKKSEINFKITLDENQIPEKIEWDATDAGEAGLKEAKAIMIGLWDAKENNSLRIDLWTKDMTTSEMRHFLYQNFITMSDTYERATNDKELAEEIRTFGKNLGEKMLNNQ